MKALAIMLLLVPAVLAAQQPLRPHAFDLPTPPLQPFAQQPVSTGRMAVGGLALGALGFFGGGFGAALLLEGDEDSADDLDALERFAVGAVVGETALLPLGVHIANQRQGNYFPALLASAAITGAALAIATAGEDHIEYLIPVPVIQLITAIAIERRTTR